jgi:tetratricopeptide (TPR) repeat protein
MGYALCAHGAHDPARQAIGRAFELDSNDPVVHTVVQCALYAMGDFRTAGAMAERTASLRTDDYYSASIAARTAAGLGEADRAITLARFALARTDNWLAIDPSDQLADGMRGTMLAMAGREHEARQTLLENVCVGSLVGYYAALTAARIGDVTEALKRLQCIIDRGWRHWSLLAVEPLLATVRREERFKKMVPSSAH